MGLTHLASSLSKSFGWPWLSGEKLHWFANTAASVIAGPSNEGSIECRDIYRQNAVTRMNRMGISVRDGAQEEFTLAEEESEGDPIQAANATTSSAPKVLLLTWPNHRKWHREALRGKLETSTGGKPLKLLFIVLLITTETLQGRFLGAETQELADRNFKAKVDDIQQPDADEGTDVVVVDAEASVEDQLSRIEQAIKENIAAEGSSE